MKREGWLLIVLLAAGGAGHAPPLPVPPIPPAHPPADNSIAPVPNQDANAPPQGPQPLADLTIQDFRVNTYTQGLGYVPGSQFQTSEDKRPIQTPGLTWKVPLQ
jgi:hypothetical protein